MPAKSKAKPKHWWQKLDEQDVRAALEEAMVDANGLDEQHTGLLSAIEEGLTQSGWPANAIVEWCDAMIRADRVGFVCLDELKSLRKRFGSRVIRA